MLRKFTAIRFAILALFILGAVMIACSCSQGSRKSLASFVSVEESGLSGEGAAVVVVDWEGIKNEVLGSVPTADDARDAYYEKAAGLENSLSFVLDKTDKLSNGDVVTVSIVCSEKASISYNIKMFDSFTVTLEGFLKQTKVDLFEALDLAFVGSSPSVSVTMKNVGKNEFLKAVTFTANKTDGLALGDEILVTATYPEDMAEMLGYMPLATTKVYKVEGVSYYPYSYAELPADLMKSLTPMSLLQVNNRWKNYSEVILSVMGNNVDRQPYRDSKVTDIQIQDPILMEIVVLTRRDTSGSWFGSYNYVFFVYKTIVNDSVLNAETEIYQCVVYSDIFVNEHGAATYSQWNTEKPQYEMYDLEKLTTILQEEYVAYNCEIVLK